MTKAADLSDFDAMERELGVGKGCLTGRILETLDPERKRAFETALKERKHTYVVMAKTVTKWGQKISPDTISRHVKQDCSCASR